MKGQSIIELLVGITVGALLFIGAAAVIAPSLRGNSSANQVETETQLAGELMRNAKTWSEGNWNAVIALSTSSLNPYYLITSSSPYTAATGTQTIAANGAISLPSSTRYFYLGDVYRDSNGNVTSTMVGNNYDPSTKQITVLSGAVGISKPTTTLISYLTRNLSLVFDQTDWSGGSGQNGPATTTNNQFVSATGTDYTSTPGSILASAATGTLDGTTFDTGVASGSQYNSILWQGSSGSGSTVQFQFAASNSSSGPWNFQGTDGTANTYYTPSGPGSSVSLSYAAFSGLRYFRYRVAITQGSTSSRVDDIMVNWSP